MQLRLKDASKLRRKDILIISAIFWLGAFFLYLAYHHWGTSVIDDIYNERSLGFLNEIIDHRDRHSLTYYYAKADAAICRLILALCLLPFAYALFVFLRSNAASRLIAPVFLIDLVLPIIYLMSFALPGGFLRDFVDLNEEMNLPTWYSSVKLFLIGFLFLTLAHKFRSHGNRGMWVMLAFASTFLLLSLDEFAAIHEQVGYFSDKLLPGGDRHATVFSQTGIWMFLVAIPFLIFIFYMVAILRKYVRDPLIIRKYVGGLSVFVGSAAGIEMLSNFVQVENAVFQVATEECGEMLGVTIILWATYDLLVHYSMYIFISRAKA